jgi:hypothetical protein
MRCRRLLGRLPALAEAVVSVALINYLKIIAI